jgi:dolichyl-phosphate-mannose-protein mannosyltransferase
VNHPGGRPRQLLAPILLGAVLLLAIAIRVPAVAVTGHTGDVHVVANWAERMAAVGPLQYYQPNGSIYPALLYVYWPLGAMFDGDALNVAIKALSIPFDIAVGLLLFFIVRPRAGDVAAVGAAALYLLNPGVILAGPVWGQIDAAGTLVFVATLVAAAARRYVLAGALGMIAGLIKPQFGMVLLPVLLLAILAWRERRGWWPAIGVVAGSVAAYVVIAGPLLLSPIQHLQNIAEVTGIRPDASVLAPNLWALLVGYDVPDTGYTLLGGALLLAGLAAAQLPLFGKRDLRALLVVGAFIVFAFYFLPTRVHERYLFPAMAVLAPLAAVSGRVLIAYVALALSFAESILYALVATTPFSLPRNWEAVLVTRDTVVWLSLAMIGSAAVLVVLLASGAAERLSDDHQYSGSLSDSGAPG